MASIFLRKIAATLFLGCTLLCGFALNSDSTFAATAAGDQAVAPGAVAADTGVADTSGASQATTAPSSGTPASNTIALPNFLGDKITTPQALIGRLINAFLGILGSIALCIFIYGGMTWMTAFGNSKKVDEGRETMLWAVAGIVVIFASYAIVRFLFQSVVQIGS